jgi:thioredoxin 1
MMTELTNETYENFISNEELSVVKIGADWCGPCRMVEPFLNKLSESEDYTIGSIDADKQKDLAISLQVRSIPTTIFFKNGQELHRRVGAYSEEDFKSMVNEYK